MSVRSWDLLKTPGKPTIHGTELLTKKVGAASYKYSVFTGKK